MKQTIKIRYPKYFYKLDNEFIYHKNSGSIVGIFKDNGFSFVEEDNDIVVYKVIDKEQTKLLITPTIILELIEQKN